MEGKVGARRRASSRPSSGSSRRCFSRLRTLSRRALSRAATSLPRLRPPVWSEGKRLLAAPGVASSAPRSWPLAAASGPAPPGSEAPVAAEVATSATQVAVVAVSPFCVSEPPCPKGSSSQSSVTWWSAGWWSAAAGGSSTARCSAAPVEAEDRPPALWPAAALLPTLPRTLVSPRHLPASLSNLETTVMLARGASPPPLSLRLHGCSPLSMRLRAKTPAAVGAPQGRPRCFALRLPHAPQRRQKTKGRGPSTLERTWPLSAHWAAEASPKPPVHVAAFCLAVRSAPTDQVLQMAHRHLPAAWLQ